MSSKRALSSAVKLLRGAKRLKRMTLTITDPNLEQKLAYILPFLKLFSSRVGLSSENLFRTLRSGDSRYVREGFHALDFDDWCRCLHKMSLFPIPVLASCARDLQEKDRAYACLLHNLPQSVYICLLYWCVQPSVLSELTRRASLNESKYIELLTVDNVCTLKDWMTVPSMPRRWSMHTASSAQVFENTYRTLCHSEIEPSARVCCSIVPKWSRLTRAWARRNVVLGQKIDSIDAWLKQLRVCDLTFEDIALDHLQIHEH